MTTSQNALGRQDNVKSSIGSGTKPVELLDNSDLGWIVDELRDLPRQSSFFEDVPDDPLWVHEQLETMHDAEILHGVVHHDTNSFLLFIVNRPWYADRIEINEMILWVPKRHRGSRVAYELVREFTIEALNWHPHSIHAGHTLDITEKERTLRLYEKAGFSPHNGGVILRP